MEKIFEKYGIEIYKDNEKYYIRADTGGFLIKYEDIEVTEEEAERAQKSANDADALLLELNDKKRIRH